nr:HD domain-containing protein [Arsenicitalea aurantiaca]
MHTRFQHTLGVMHTASRMFDALVSDKRSRELLKTQLHVTESVIERQRIIIRLAALVHDLGHAPFSHAAETLMPEKASGLPGKSKLYSHENYSVEIFKKEIYPLIKDNGEISSNQITTAEVTGLIEGTPVNALGALCKDIISGRIDADRMDYLLRDSYYCGVRYGHYEIDRLINTICVLEDDDDGTLSIGVTEDGLHAAEGLLIARYMMFHNVYLHKTRVVYDYHYQHALRKMIGGTFPKPTTSSNLRKYMNWDDWKVLGMIAAKKAGDHGDILANRNHYKLVYQTSESHENSDSNKLAFEKFEAAASICAKVPHYVWREDKSFAADVQVLVRDSGRAHIKPLLELSGVVKSLRPLKQKRLYVSDSHSDSMRSEIESV